MRFSALTRSLLAICIGAFGLSVVNPNQAAAQEAESLVTSLVSRLDLPPLEEASIYLPSQPNLRLVIRLGDRRVYLYRDEQLHVSYPIAVGREGWETPTGNFMVTQKIKDPSWEHPWTGEVVPPGPDNPLGMGWLGFWSDGVNSVGFHGTTDESKIGQAVSHGCVRMRNQDILALLTQVEVGTPVIVEP